MCFKCLKPGHTLQECRNRINCKHCEGSHHSLLHSGDRNGSTPAGSGAVLALGASASSHSFNQNKLVMTCEAEATGPTGKKIRVRAMLDPGAAISSVSTRIAKILELKPLDATLDVETFNSTEDQICKTTNFTLSSCLKKDWSHRVSAVIADKIISRQPQQDASEVKNLVEAQGLTPADSQFHRPGRIDVLLGVDVLPHVQTREGSESSITAIDTVFGHVFMGTYEATSQEEPKTVNVHLANSIAVIPSDDSLSRALTKFWEVEEPPVEKKTLSSEEKRVVAEYAVNHVFYPNAGRYEVHLPRKIGDLRLGESKNRALQRFHQNEKSLQRKGNWAMFQKVIQEYLNLDHARLCTEEELALPVGEGYYLPMHSVIKASSTTTKMRVVFDASAPTTSGLSLNDTLAVGPMLHPTLDQILIRFRSYRVALTGDIQKMYREILLAQSDQQYHRFLWRSQVDQPIREYVMNRVTFGVASSPYLAVQTLQQTASDFGQGCLGTEYHIHNSFYVEGGADSVGEAVALQKEITSALTKGGFSLRKFRSNSPTVLAAIPVDLVEPMPNKDLIDCHSGAYPKALGVRWNSEKDTMSVDVSSQTKYALTKRGILSDISKVFDVLGWITPVILPMKLLMQKL